MSRFLPPNNKELFPMGDTPDTSVHALVCAQSFATGRRVVKKGTRVRSDDPIVQGRDKYFVAVNAELGLDKLQQLGPTDNEGGDASTEKATANPGQKRGAAKPKDEGK